MIQRLRIRFITVYMLALTLVLLVSLGSLNWMNYRRMISDADTLLTMLSSNNGTFPAQSQWDNPRWDRPPRTPDHRGQRLLSPETPFESRFFSVRLDAQGNPQAIDLGRIAAVDQDTALQYAQTVLCSGKQKGFLLDYRYLASQQEDSTLIIFLYRGKSLAQFREVLLGSIEISLLVLAGVLLLVILLSPRVVKPFAETYARQRQFVTDAGHELKTPLTVIQADADLAELDCPDSEWIADIRRQAQRLTGLTQDLITLARMDEATAVMQAVPFSLSDAAEDTVQSFLSLAKQHDLTVTADIPPFLTCMGNEQDIRKLLSILLDNAVKYTPSSGQILLTLEKKNKWLSLRVDNTLKNPMDSVQLNSLFDRFYRADASRNSTVSGYGLGLSIAQSIVFAHKGTIQAQCPDDLTLSFRITLPCG